MFHGIYLPCPVLGILLVTYPIITGSDQFFITSQIPPKASEARRVPPFCKLNLYLYHSSREHIQISAEDSFVQRMQSLEGTP